MSSFITRRRIPRKGIWGTAAVGVAAAVASASLAGAQAPAAPDGSAGGAAAASIVTQCGQNLSSTVITNNSPSTTNVAGFQTLPGSVKEFAVPAGASRCIKVLLTAETACGPTAAADFCYVRATLDGVPMNPNGTGFQAMDSEDSTASAHAYEWVKRVGAGNHDVRIEWRVLNAGTVFFADDRTVDIGIYQ